MPREQLVSQRDHLKNLIRTYSRRLQLLQEQLARQGLNSPPEIIMEIEDIKAKLEGLEVELKQAASSPELLPPVNELVHIQEQLALLETVQHSSTEPQRFQYKIEELKHLIATWEGRIEDQRQRIAVGLEKQRQETIERDQPKPGQKLIRVMGRPPLGEVEYFKDRQQERATIGRLLAEPTTRLVSVIGQGGMGKTALASKILADLERHRWPHTDEDLPLDGIVYLSTRTAGISLERLFLDCAQLLGEEAEKRLTTIWTNPKLGTEDKISHLLEALQEGSYVILLDNLEDLLDDQGQLVDQDLRLFFDRSLTTVHGARLLVTSRVTLAFKGEVMRFDRQVKLLDGLPVEDGVALLRELDPNGDYGLRDAPDEQLAQAVSLVHGVPRALEVLVGILANDPFASLAEVLVQFYQQADVVQGLIEENYKRLDSPARRVIEALAVFKRPVPPLAVDYLLELFFPGLDVPGILRRLTRTNILTINRVTKTVVLHPIDQDYAYSQLPEEGTDESAYTRRALEHRAADYYVQLRTPSETWKTIHDLEPQLAEFEHRMRAREFDGACQVLESIDYDYLYLWGYYNRLIEMRKKLLERLSDPRLKANNLGSLGIAYHALGQAERSIKFYENATYIAHNIGDTAEEGRHLRNLGNAYRDLGQSRQSIELYEAALSIFRVIGRRREEGATLGNLGNIYHYLGQYEQALKFYEEALIIYRDIGDRRREGAELSNMADTFRELRQIGRAVELYENALTIAREIGDRRSIAAELGGLGNLYRSLGQVRQAIRLSEEALVIVRDIGDRRREGVQLGHLGAAYYALGQVDKATKFYYEALIIARELGDRRKEVVWLNNLGNIYYGLKEIEQAIKLYEEALVIAREIGYRLGESYQLVRLSEALITIGEQSRAKQFCTEALALEMPATSYRAAVVLGIVLLHLQASDVSKVFSDAVTRCYTVVSKSPGTYEPYYTLAAALVGQAVCDPRWVHEDERNTLLIPAMDEYSRALDICATLGVIQDALRDLELIRTANVEGLEPVFKFLQNRLKE